MTGSRGIITSTEQSKAAGHRLVRRHDLRAHLLSRLRHRRCGDSSLCAVRTGAVRGGGAFGGLLVGAERQERRCRQP